jgi:hypothetical protein
VACGSAGTAVQGQGRGGRLSGFTGRGVCAWPVVGGEAVCVRVGELFDCLI